MIPRVRPSWALGDLRAALTAGDGAVDAFERELAAYFGKRHALVFPYGRSAIHACLVALGRTGEVVQPAYNCVVVAHATVLAGSRPVFVDAQRSSPNQDPDEMAARVGDDTVAVVPTSIFGMTFDAAALVEAVRRRNSRALVLMDCCQCFDARWNGAELAAQGDAAVLAFGVGKPMTTLFGGALVTDRDDLAAAVRGVRDASFTARSAVGRAGRWAYLLGTALAFTGAGTRLVDGLENARTPVRGWLARLRAREAIRLPADNTTAMTAMEAGIGRTQLRRVAGFLARRREIAAVYARELRGVAGLELLDWPEGSSYAIWAARVRDPAARPAVLAALRRAGVQGDTTLGYVVPGLACYRAVGHDDAGFPNAIAWARTVINLPNHPTMTDRQVARVVRAAQRAFDARHVRAVVGPAAA